MYARILIIDDEQRLRFTIRTILKSCGYDVTDAGNYIQALKALSEKKFDLILSDIILEDKTGLDILQYIKDNNIKSPVIMITGHPSVDTASEALRLGAFDYIKKPLKKDTLIKVVTRALKHRELKGEKDRYKANLEAIFRSVNEGIITVDKNLQVTEINPLAKKIFGISEKLKDNSLDFMGSFREECIYAIKKALKNGENVNLSHMEVTEESKRKYLTVTVSPLLDQEEKIFGSVILIRDETRLTNLEIELSERQKFHNILGKSDKIQEIYSLIESLAGVQTTVLITGESGTGKELVANAIHYAGKSNMPYIKVNCTALSENLLESELFGHVKGAFTGAIKNTTGRFQLAHKGTIFLDEIGDITPAMQAKILRVIQEGEFEKLGEAKTIKVDVRIIAATNKDLRTEVTRGNFREDLFYRLKVMEIDIPPLRERKEDIPLLVEHFIKKFNTKLNKNIENLSEEVINIFMSYRWPGNIRELEHTIEHAFILCRNSVITLKHLPKDLKNASKEIIPEEEIHKKSLKKKKPDKEMIKKALKKTGWNKAKASKILGITRPTLYKKIIDYNLSENF